MPSCASICLVAALPRYITLWHPVGRDLIWVNLVYNLYEKKGGPQTGWPGILEYVLLGDWNWVYSHWMPLTNLFPTPTPTQSLATSSKLNLFSYPPSLDLSIEPKINLNTLGYRLVYWQYENIFFSHDFADFNNNTCRFIFKYYVFNLRREGVSKIFKNLMT